MTTKKLRLNATNGELNTTVCIRLWYILTELVAIHPNLNTTVCIRLWLILNWITKLDILMSNCYNPICLHTCREPETQN